MVLSKARRCLEVITSYSGGYRFDCRLWRLSCRLFKAMRQSWCLKVVCANSCRSRYIFKLLKLSSYFTYHQVEHSKILHGAQIAFKCSVWTFTLYSVNRLVTRWRVFTARYELGFYINQTRFAFKGLIVVLFSLLWWVSEQVREPKIPSAKSDAFCLGLIIWTTKKLAGKEAQKNVLDFSPQLFLRAFFGGYHLSSSCTQTFV
jgi:hypothetical protein